MNLRKKRLQSPKLKLFFLQFDKQMCIFVFISNCLSDSYKAHCENLQHGKFVLLNVTQGNLDITELMSWSLE